MRAAKVRPVRVALYGRAGGALQAVVSHWALRGRGQTDRRGGEIGSTFAALHLVGELSTRSEEFRTRGAAHNVRQHFTGIKHFHHPVVGELHLLFESMQLSADTGLSLYVYSPEPGTASVDAIRLLACWAAANTQLTSRMSA